MLKHRCDGYLYIFIYNNKIYKNMHIKKASIDYDQDFLGRNRTTAYNDDFTSIGLYGRRINIHDKPNTPFYGPNYIVFWFNDINESNLINILKYFVRQTASDSYRLSIKRNRLKYNLIRVCKDIYTNI